MTGQEYFREWLKEVEGADEAARILGYTPAAIRHWANGTRNLTPERAVELELATFGRLDRVCLIFGTDYAGRRPRRAA